MAIPPSFPATLPSPNNTQYAETLRIIGISFGDGYRQEFGDGPSPKERTHTLSWDPITVASADAICAYLDSMVGSPFLYRLPRERAPRRWVWISRQRTWPHPPALDALSVTLEERFV